MLDENIVRSALARPRHRWSYDEEADLADLAATYLVGFSRSQGFRDGNERTALAEADDEEVARHLRDRIERSE